MARDIIEDILTILVIISFLIAIFILLWKIFGDSPTIIDFLTTLVVGLVLYVFKAEYTRGKFEGRFNSFIYYTKDGFIRVKEDINNLGNDMKENITNIRGDITTFQKEINENIKSLRKEIKFRGRK